MSVPAIQSEFRTSSHEEDLVRFARSALSSLKRGDPLRKLHFDSFDRVFDALEHDPGEFLIHDRGRGVFKRGSSPKDMFEDERMYLYRIFLQRSYESGNNKVYVSPRIVFLNASKLSFSYLDSVFPVQILDRHVRFRYIQRTTRVLDAKSVTYILGLGMATLMVHALEDSYLKVEKNLLDTSAPNEVVRRPVFVPSNDGLYVGDFYGIDEEFKRVFCYLFASREASLVPQDFIANPQRHPQSSPNTGFALCSNPKLPPPKDRILYAKESNKSPLNQDSFIRINTFMPKWDLSPSKERVYERLNAIFSTPERKKAVMDFVMKYFIPLMDGLDTPLFNNPTLRQIVAEIREVVKTDDWLALEDSTVQARHEKLQQKALLAEQQAKSVPK
jgi:hypothetical protein